MPANLVPDDIAERLPLLDGTPTDPDYETVWFDLDEGEHVRFSDGSFSDVFVGTTARGRRIALKEFRQPEQSQVGRMGQRELVAKEWRAAQTNISPHVVRARACFLTRRSGAAMAWILVMDLVPGPSLLDVLGAVRGDTDIPPEIPPETQRAWLLAGLEGLAALAETDHQLRDIKPANIKLSNKDWWDATPVFLDHGAGRRGGTATVGHFGTQDYAAPEYILKTQGQRIPKADIYSFGATLIDVLTGGQGFLPESLPNGKVLHHQGFQRGLVARPNLDDPRITSDVARILRGALVKNPERRPSAHELLRLVRDASFPMPDWDPNAPYVRPRDAEHSSSTGSDASDGELSGDRPDPVRIDPVERTGATMHMVSFDQVTLLPLLPDLEHLEAKVHDPRQSAHVLERLAGVDSRYLTRDSERTIYRVLGVLLALYFVYATMAVASLVQMASGEDGPWVWVVGVLAGILVATAMVSLDRSIVASSSVDLSRLDDPKVDENPLKKGMSGSMVVRILFAVLFALFVGEAANLALFDRDIQAQLSVQLEERVSVRAGELAQDAEAEIGRQEAVVREAAAAIVAYPVKTAELRGLANAERDGTGGTGVVGCGPYCLELIDQANERDLNQLGYEAGKNEEIRIANAAITKSEEAVATSTADARAELEKDDGLFAREKALWTMLLTDGWLVAKYVIVSLLFLMLELAAVVIKLGSRGNTYERAQARGLRRKERANLLRHGVAAKLMDRRAAQNEELLADADAEFYARARGRGSS